MDKINNLSDVVKILEKELGFTIKYQNDFDKFYEFEKSGKIFRMVIEKNDERYKLIFADKNGRFIGKIRNKYLLDKNGKFNIDEIVSFIKNRIIPVLNEEIEMKADELGKFAKRIYEPSLLKLWRKNEEYDIGIITAIRTYNNCGYIYDENGNETAKWCEDEDEPITLTSKEKRKRNIALYSDLLGRGYSVFKVIGKFKESEETTTIVAGYFVLDDKNTQNLKKDLMYLGEKYNQDGVLYAPKGAINGKAKASFIGTNRCCNNPIGYHKKIQIDTILKNGYPENLLYIHGRPFFFESIAQSQRVFQSMSNAVMANVFAKEYEKEFQKKGNINKDWSEDAFD